MNRILLKNLITMFFWLYAGIFIAAPVEEVRREQERQQENKRVQDQKLQAEARAKEQARIRNIQEEAVRKKAEEQVKNKDESKTKSAADDSGRNLEEKKKNEQSKQGNQKILEFIAKPEFKIIKDLLDKMGFDDSFMEKVKNNSVKEEDLIKLGSKFPKDLDEIKRRFGEQKISEEQKKVLTSFLSTINESIKSILPEKLNIEDINNLLTNLAKPVDEQYKNLVEKDEESSKFLSYGKMRMIMLLGIAILGIFITYEGIKHDNKLLIFIGIVTLGLDYFAGDFSKGPRWSKSSKAAEPSMGR